MAAYSSSQTGDWDQAATWGDSGPPGDGDTATIAAGHTVTITSSSVVTVGADTGDVADLAIDIADGGKLLIDTDATLTLGGTLKNGGAVEMNAGATISVTGSAEYRVGIYSATDPNWHCTWDVEGTSSNKCRIAGAATDDRGSFGAYSWLSPAGGVSLKHCQFQYLGSSGGDPGFAVVSRPQSDAALVIEDCTFDDIYDIDVSVADDTTIPISIKRNTYTNTGLDFASWNLNGKSGEVELIGNVFDKAVTTIKCPNGTIRLNIFEQEFTFLNVDHGGCTYDTNFIGVQSSASAALNINTLRGCEAKDLYIANTLGCTNWHAVSGADAQDGAFAIEGWIFDPWGSNNSDDSDLLLGAASANLLTVKNMLVMPLPNGDGQGCFSNQNNTNYRAFYHNFLAANKDSSEGTTIRVGENHDPSADQVAAAKSNFWHAPDDSGHCYERQVSATINDVQDAFDESGIDFNGKYNTSAGAHGRGFHSTATTERMWTGTTGDLDTEAQQVGADKHVVTALPVIIDYGRTMADYGAEVGQSSTYAAVLTYLKTDPTNRLGAAIAWVKQGYRIVSWQHTRRRNSHDGSPLGLDRFYVQGGSDTWTGTAFDPNNWTNYAQARSATGISGSLTNFSEYIDLSELGDDWWDLVQSDGGDIRITDGSDTELAFDILTLDTTAKTGWLRVLIPTVAAGGVATVRVWAGYTGGTAYMYLPGDTYGSDAVYEDHNQYLGLGNSPRDYTDVENDGTLSSALQIGGTYGTDQPAGGMTFAGDGDPGTGAGDYIDNGVSICAASSTYAMAAMVYANSGQSGQQTILSDYGTSGDMSFLLRYDADNGDLELYLRKDDDTEVSCSNAVSIEAVWHHVAVDFTGGVGTVYLDGLALDNAADFSGAATLNAADANMYWGATAANDTDGFTGQLAELTQYSSARGTDWMQHLADSLLDNSTHWGGSWAMGGDGGPLPLALGLAITG